MNIGNSDDEFAAFEAAGDVEVGESQKDVKTAEAGEGEEEKPKPKPRGVPKMKEEPKAKPEIEVSKDGTTQEDDGDEAGEEDDGEEEKPRKTAAEHQIERLKREKADLNKRLRALERSGGTSPEITARLEAIEKGLPGRNSSDTQGTGAPEPDPTDAKKYPLGHLDDRYIEDKLEWLADKKAAERADAVLQRQQENERNEAVNRQQEALLEKVDDLAVKGSELFEDFQETVVEAGMRGDYDLQQTTFEACSESEYGAQILYELSQDKKEASRVAKLSHLGQLKFVQEREAEIAAGKKPRTKPQAGDPPRNTPRGANSKTTISPATENLNDFEKAWKQDEARTK